MHESIVTIAKTPISMVRRASNYLVPETLFGRTPQPFYFNLVVSPPEMRRLARRKLPYLRAASELGGCADTQLEGIRVGHNGS
jgi:hypothetical protein